MTMQGTDGSTFMMKNVRDQPYIESGCATDNSRTALLSSPVKRVIGIGQNNNDQAFLAVVISKKSVNHR